MILVLLLVGFTVGLILVSELFIDFDQNLENAISKRKYYTYGSIAVVSLTLFIFTLILIFNGLLHSNDSPVPNFKPNSNDLKLAQQNSPYYNKLLYIKQVDDVNATKNHIVHKYAIYEKSKSNSLIKITDYQEYPTTLKTNNSVTLYEHYGLAIPQKTTFNIKKHPFLIIDTEVDTSKSIAYGKSKIAKLDIPMEMKNGDVIKIQTVNISYDKSPDLNIYDFQLVD